MRSRPQYKQRQNANMLESLKNLMAELGGGHKHQDRFGDDDYRVASAAMLIHASVVDGAMSGPERHKLYEIVKTRFELDDTSTTELIAQAAAAENEAVDLYHFTRLLNHSLDAIGRRRLIEMMWEMVYADGQVNEIEENLIWRAADLLGISSRDRIEIRHLVTGRKDGSDAP